MYSPVRLHWLREYVSKSGQYLQHSSPFSKLMSTIIVVYSVHPLIIERLPCIHSFDAVVAAADGSIKKLIDGLALLPAFGAARPPDVNRVAGRFGHPNIGSVRDHSVYLAYLHVSPQRFLLVSSVLFTAIPALRRSLMRSGRQKR